MAWTSASTIYLYKKKRGLEVDGSKERGMKIEIYIYTYIYKEKKKENKAKEEDEEKEEMADVTYLASTSLISRFVLFE